MRTVAKVRTAVGNCTSHFAIARSTTIRQTQPPPQKKNTKKKHEPNTSIGLACLLPLRVASTPVLVLVAAVCSVQGACSCSLCLVLVLVAGCGSFFVACCVLRVVWLCVVLGIWPFAFVFRVLCFRRSGVFVFVRWICSCLECLMLMLVAADADAGLRLLPFGLLAFRSY